jgi:hypothetical protein
MKRWLVKGVMFLLLGAILNVAVVVGVVFVLRRFDPRQDQRVTYYKDVVGEVRWKTSLINMSTMGIAWSKRERWYLSLKKHPDTGPTSFPIWARTLCSPLPEFVGGSMMIEERIVVGRGWPCIAASFEILHDKNNQVTHAIDFGDSWKDEDAIPRLIPCRIAWPGFSVNTLLYGAVLWMLVATISAIRRGWRIKRGVCQVCTYPVGTSDVCTECGTPVIRKAPQVMM